MKAMISLFGYLLIILVLSLNVAAAYQTETPTLGELFQPIAVSTRIHYTRITSTDADLMKQIAAWQFDTGWTPDWYNGDPPIGEPEREIRFQTDGTEEGEVIMLVFASKDNPEIVYPALFTYTRIFGDHADKDLKNHPDLGWWSMRRIDLDELIDALEG